MRSQLHRQIYGSKSSQGTHFIPSLLLKLHCCFNAAFDQLDELKTDIHIWSR